jgi:hypothetical protein
MTRADFIEEFKNLVGLEPGTDDFGTAHSKLAQLIGVRLFDPRILEAARHLAAWRTHSQRFDRAFDAAVDEGRAMPSQRKMLQRFAMRDPEAAIALVDALKPVTSPAPIRSRRAPDGVDARRFDLDQRIHAYALEHGIDYSTAFDRVVVSAA